VQVLWWQLQHPETLMKKCILVVLVVRGVPLTAAASARNGSLVRNRTE
jgi:hypothetical protein